MSELCGVEHRLYNHTSKWSPTFDMPEHELEALRNELISLSADSVTFMVTHVEGDAFYARAYRDWCKRQARCHKILHQLYTHGYVAWYTIRGLNIRWQWMDTFSLKVHRAYLKRLPLQCKRLAVPEVQSTPYYMWWLHGTHKTIQVCNMWGVHAETLQDKLDGIALRCKIGASPDVAQIDVWTAKLYERALTGDCNSLTSSDKSDGQMAHYMQMKLEGAVFQMELRAPTPVKHSVKRALVNKEREKRAKLINKWRR